MFTATYGFPTKVASTFIMLSSLCVIQPELLKLINSGHPNRDKFLSYFGAATIGTLLITPPNYQSDKRLSQVKIVNSFLTLPAKTPIREIFKSLVYPNVLLKKDYKSVLLQMGIHTALRLLQNTAVFATVDGIMKPKEPIKNELKNPTSDSNKLSVTNWTTFFTTKFSPCTESKDSNPSLNSMRVWKRN